MNVIATSINGKVVSLDNNLVTIETQTGHTFADLGYEFPLKIEVGDKIELEGTNFAIVNNRIIHMITEDIELIRINGWNASFKEVPSAMRLTSFEPGSIGDLLQRAKKELGE